MRRWGYASLFFLAGACLVALVLWRSGLDWEAVSRTAAGAHPGLLVLALALFLGPYLLSALKWRLVTEAQSDERLGLFFYLRYVALSVALGQLVPISFANASVRAVALKRREVMPVTKTTALFLWDQGFDFGALALLLAVGLLYLYAGLSFPAAAGAYLAGVALVLGLMPIWTRLVAGTARLLSRRRLPAVVADKLSALSEANILKVSVARRLFALACCKALSGALVYTAIIWALGRGGMLAAAFWGAPSAEMAGVLSQMPGGLGALDLTWVGLLSSNGLTAAAAAGVTLGIRCVLLAGNMLLPALIWGPYVLLARPRGN